MKPRSRTPRSSAVRSSSTFRSNYDYLRRRGIIGSPLISRESHRASSTSNFPRKISQRSTNENCISSVYAYIYKSLDPFRIVYRILLVKSCELGSADTFAVDDSNGSPMKRTPESLCRHKETVDARPAPHFYAGVLSVNNTSVLSASLYVTSLMYNARLHAYLHSGLLLPFLSPFFSHFFPLFFALFLTVPHLLVTVSQSMFYTKHSIDRLNKSGADSTLTSQAM